MEKENPKHIVMTFEAYEKLLNYLSSFEYKVIAQAISEIVSDVNNCAPNYTVVGNDVETVIPEDDKE